MSTACVPKRRRIDAPPGGSINTHAYVREKAVRNLAAEHDVFEEGILAIRSLVEEAVLGVECQRLLVERVGLVFLYFRDERLVEVELAYVGYFATCNGAIGFAGDVCVYHG